MQVLVLSLPLGSGHTSAANSISQALRSEFPSAAIDVVDISGVVLPRLRLSRHLRRIYRLSATMWNGTIHALLYKVADRFPTLVSGLLSRIFKRWVESFLKEYGSVHVVISTFSVVGYIVAQCRSRPSTVASFVTDAGRVNRIWFAGRVDKYILSDPGSCEVAAKCGIPMHRVIVAGPPIPRVNPQQIQDRVSARRALGLREDHFTVLFTSGGAGIGKGVLSTAEAAAKGEFELQAILNAGDNPRLLRAFRSLTFPTPPHVTGLEKDFLSLLLACDVVVGKAGFLTLIESINVKRPTLVVDVLPGQEAGNVAFAAALGGARCVSPADAVTLLNRYAEDERALHNDFAMDDAYRELSERGYSFGNAIKDVARDGYSDAQ